MLDGVDGDGRQEGRPDKSGVGRGEAPVVAHPCAERAGSGVSSATWRSALAASGYGGGPKPITDRTRSGRLSAWRRIHSIYLTGR